VLSLFLKQIPLSDVAGLVARGEAVGGDEAESLEAAARGKVPASTTGAPAFDRASGGDGELADADREQSPR